MGFEIRNLSRSFDARRARLFNYFGLDVVIDVGANRGQFAESLRKYGYKGLILSFEPLATPFLELKEKANHDRNWRVFQLALGSRNETTIMNVSQNVVSSSLFDATELSTRTAPSSAPRGTAKVQVRRLDDLVNEHLESTSSIGLKIDAQGFEAQVLGGSEELLPRVRVLEIELSLQELYKGQELFLTLHTKLVDSGFHLIAIGEQFFSMETGLTLSVDCTYGRLSDAPSRRTTFVAE